MKETWKPIEQFANYYISNLGRIKRILDNKERISEYNKIGNRGNVYTTISYWKNKNL